MIIDKIEGTKVPRDPVYFAIFNAALEWASQLIEIASLTPGLDDNFNPSKTGCAAVLADEIRAHKKNPGFQQDFFDAIRADPVMLAEDKEFWLSLQDNK